MIAIILAYFIGSIPTGLILSKLMLGTDIRKHGSGNIGTTNAYRLGGKKMGIYTLIGDAGKAIVALTIADLVAPHDYQVKCLAALMVAVGHMFSVFLKFKGGKGVATCIASLMIIAPNVATVAIMVFMSLIYLTRYVSLASVVGSIAAAFASLIAGHGVLIMVVWIMAFLIIFKHKDNIRRLKLGIESKI